MRRVRIPHDLNGQDRFVLGLSVTSLAALLFGLLAAYTILHLDSPLGLRLILATPVAVAAVVFAWIRPAGRSLGHWLLAAMAFKLSGSSGHGRDVRHVPAPAPRLSVVTQALTVAAQPTEGPVDEGILELPGADPADDSRDDPALSAPVPVYIGGPQVITFFSAKGGTGRTTLATEVACLLALKGRYRESAGGKPKRLKVALVDCDLRSANVSARVGLAQPTILDYLTDLSPRRQLFDFVQTHTPSGLQVLLGPPKCLVGKGEDLLSIPQAAEIASLMKEGGFQFIFVDMSSSLTDLEVYLLEAADRVFCTVTPTAGAIQDLYRGVEVLRRLGLGPKLRYVANKMRGRHDLSEPMGDLGGSLAAEIPYDIGLEVAENEHRPLVLHGQSPASEPLWRLASAIYPALQLPVTRPAFAPLTWLTRWRHAG